ncbi:hypothetical protein CES86_1700 [Brucella lupini]|uniref:Uncharacterized protein n=1 Tax=Brucella lupini TaxID=255457 RepID=A0A256GUF0_9HYPH|nr:hypothetical protein CES86_1700 [Brucella lupini]
MERPWGVVGRRGSHHGQWGHVIVVAELRRAVGGASGERCCCKQASRHCGFTESRMSGLC